MGALSLDLLLAVLFSVVLAVDARAASGYRGPKSDHFDGKRFTEYRAMKAGTIFKWMWTRKPGPWKPWRDVPPGPKPPCKVGEGDLRVTFVGHATVLVQMDGLNFLTDPVWSDRVGPASWLGPGRVRPPGIRFEELPPIDVVLLSHNHYDHLDLPTLRRLQVSSNPLIVTGLGVGSFLKAKGFGRVAELDWWQSVTLATGRKITAAEVRHFSGRLPWDQNRTIWVGFMVEGSRGGVYFGGDTGYGPHFKATREKLGSPRFAILPIGAYLPAYIMAPVHLNPIEAVQAFHDLGAAHGCPVHFGTFRVADDGEDEPVELLGKVISGDPAVAGRFRVVGFGEGWDVP
ncbi:MAG: MBL fold metallo-hydrolase [Candidatus Coatesbacteria bacterium]